MLSLALEAIDMQCNVVEALHQDKWNMQYSGLLHRTLMDVVQRLKDRPAVIRAEAPLREIIHQFVLHEISST